MATCYHRGVMRRPAGMSRRTVRSAGTGPGGQEGYRRPGDVPSGGGRSPLFRRTVEALAAVLVVASLYAFYSAMTFLGAQDYVAALLVAVVGIALMRSGVELARSALCE
jgi:hypothetical protein